MDKQAIHTFYKYLESQQTAQDFLHHCYQKIDGIDAEAKSFENCNSFMYYLQHSKQFFENGKKLDLLLQPILLFYGMVHLLKAVLLTKRPNYPESTTILAHGVSARKRKKKDYSFLDDEVKIQHHGLFPYFSEHLFAIKKFPFEKVKMEQILALIPELALLFQFQKKAHMISVGVSGSNELVFSTTMLDSYHLTARAFLNRIQTHLPDIVHSKIDTATIVIKLACPLTKSHGPFFIHTDQTIYFPKARESYLPISEMMVHYLLLYNLSMLCRYEAEWWGDLLVTKPEIDYPFISEFLGVTAEKVPLLLGNELYEQMIG